MIYQLTVDNGQCDRSEGLCTLINKQAIRRPERRCMLCTGSAIAAKVALSKNSFSETVHTGFSSSPIAVALLENDYEKW